MTNPILTHILTVKEPPALDQEEMDKLASALTEAVLQLRAGDMNGARKTLADADYLCGIRIHDQIKPSDHYLDAMLYGMGIAQLDQAMSATEILHRQQLAEHKLRAVQEAVLNNPNNTILSIMKDPDAGA